MVRGSLDEQLRVVARLEMARALSFLRREGMHTQVQAAIRFILMHNGVTVVLGGFSAMNHLEEIVPASGACSSLGLPAGVAAH